MDNQRLTNQELQSVLMFHSKTYSYQPTTSTSSTDDIQYTIEYPSEDGNLPFMDIFILLDKSTYLYKLPTHTNLYVDYNSCASSSSKDSVIISLTKLVNILCSPPSQKETIISERNNNFICISLYIQLYLKTELKTVYYSIMDCVKQKLENPNLPLNNSKENASPQLPLWPHSYPTITRKLKKTLGSYVIKVTSSLVTNP